MRIAVILIIHLNFKFVHLLQLNEYYKVLYVVSCCKFYWVGVNTKITKWHVKL